MKYLLKEEAQRLLVSVDNKRDKLLIQLGLVLGCRVSEVVNIRVKHISDDTIKIYDEKKDVYRDCVIDPVTAEDLDRYLQNGWEAEPHMPHHLLFYFSTKTANRIFKKWCSVAKIPPEKAHWHTLRHTYVIQNLDAGTPINYIVEQTGDSPMTIINIYGKPSIGQRHKMQLERGMYWLDGKVRVHKNVKNREVESR